jgi:dihydropteroate synthase
MFETVARLNVPYVLMHMRGTPQTMTQHTVYQDLIPDVLAEIQEQLTKLRKWGQTDILIDPGFGFAKRQRRTFRF